MGTQSIGSERINMGSGRMVLFWRGLKRSQCRLRVDLLALAQERQRDGDNNYGSLLRYGGCHKLIREGGRTLLVKKIYHCSISMEISKVNGTAGAEIMKEHL